MWGIHPTGWWDWLAALDWSKSDNVLSSIVGVTVLAGIAWAAIRYIFNPLAACLGRRRAQSKLLDQLACGCSVAYVESLLGASMFTGRLANDRETRTYRLPGAWVIIEIRKGAVFSYSITITNAKMHYNTRQLTFGCLDVDLGRDKFKPPEQYCEGEHYWVAVRLRHGYERYYNFREAGEMQHYWLSHNAAGVGEFGFLAGYPDIARGLYRSVHDQSQADPIDSTAVTVNTLSVTTPEVLSSDLPHAYVAIDEAQIRLAPSNKHRQSRLPKAM
ncbi:ETEC_3214 domain-containing protein [Mycolicibacterium wolinskyi]|uniref:ETEC_3214 domain-containing protein n=1 Tax=Mycolicibacterium wolinskyi TaxID=59750 RepID=UPI000AD9C3BE|nr:ETEC_3214 domain-containing protein [Mycolicibacterium wolinskyi]